MLTLTALSFYRLCFVYIVFFYIRKCIFQHLIYIFSNIQNLITICMSIQSNILSSLYSFYFYFLFLPPSIFTIPLSFPLHFTLPFMETTIFPINSPLISSFWLSLNTEALRQGSRKTQGLGVGRCVRGKTSGLRAQSHIVGLCSMYVCVCPSCSSILL